MPDKRDFEINDLLNVSMFKPIIENQIRQTAGSTSFRTLKPFPFIYL